MNTKQPQAIQTIPTQFPQVPDMTQITLDPHNPLIWFLVLATLCTSTAKSLDATANLIRAITLFLKSRKKDK